jgi:hypothetical protein
MSQAASVGSRFNNFRRRPFSDYRACVTASRSQRQSPIQRCCNYKDRKQHFGPMYERIEEIIKGGN